MKKRLPQGLVEFQKTKPPRHGRLDGSKQFLTSLIYLCPLGDVLKMIIPFYWNPGKTIIDVTAGERISWRNFPYNHRSACGFEHWHVDFADISAEAKADIHCDLREIDQYTDKIYDILFVDIPFIELDKGRESFGVKPKPFQARFRQRMGKKETREYYFRNFIPPREFFPQMVEPFNNTANSLIVKIGDSHEGGRMINNHKFAIEAFDKTENPNSEFTHIDTVHFRGNYSRRGAKLRFAQMVVTYYLIFKKDVKAR